MRSPKSDSEEVFLKPNGNFDERLFNRYELKLLATIVFKYGNWNAAQLIHFLHEEGSLWHKMVSEHNLKDHFKQIGKITNHSIEFSDLLENNPVLQIPQHKEIIYNMWEIIKNIWKTDIISFLVFLFSTWPLTSSLISLSL